MSKRRNSRENFGKKKRMFTHLSPSLWGVLAGVSLTPGPHFARSAPSLLYGGFWPVYPLHQGARPGAAAQRGSLGPPGRTLEPYNIVERVSCTCRGASV